MIRRKIFYVPGLISLVCVPVIFIYYSSIWMPKEEFVTTMYLPRDNPKYKTGDMPDFSGQNLLETIKPYRKTEVFLPKKDSKLIPLQLDFIFHEMQRISFTNQSMEVLIVHLNEETTISQFVQLMDMVTMVRLHRYAYWDDAFYFIGNEPPPPLGKENETFSCGGIRYDIPAEKEPSFWQITKNQFEQLKANKGLWLMSGFLMLSIFTSYQSLKKYLRKKPL